MQSSPYRFYGGRSIMHNFVINRIAHQMQMSNEIEFSLFNFQPMRARKKNFDKMLRIDLVIKSDRRKCILYISYAMLGCMRDKILDNLI